MPAPCPGSPGHQLTGGDWPGALPPFTRAESWSGLPIAIFSTWHSPGDIAQALDAGADSILCKDLLCRSDSWRARIREILSPTASQPPGLSTLTTPALADGDLVGALNRSFGHAERRFLSRELVSMLVRRAVRMASDSARCTQGTLEGWIAPEQIRICPDQMAQNPNPGGSAGVRSRLVGTASPSGGGRGQPGRSPGFLISTSTTTGEFTH